MTYTVGWTKSAEDRLCEIWLQADDRQAVANASDEIDVLLRHRPNEVGEIRKNRNRLLRVAPLEVYYKVFDDDCRVLIWAVWRVDEGHN